MEITFELGYALDTFYFLMSGALVMWMAAGFTMLEAGLVRAKNTTEIGTGLLNTYWFYALYYDNTQQPDKELEAYIKALEIEQK